MPIQETLQDLKAFVQADEGMEEELRNTLLGLIDEVAVDPSPDNVEALQVVLEKMAEGEKYLSVLNGLAE